MQPLPLNTGSPAKPQRLTGGRTLRFYSLVRFVVMGLLAFAITISSVPTALGQIAIPSPTLQNPTNPPPGVERYGSIEVTSVRFDGENLFKIASPTVRDRNNPGNLVPVEERAEQIEANLDRVIQDDVQLSPKGIKAETNYDLDTLQVYASTLNNDNVIFVKDKNHPEPLSILTVNQSDAAFYGKPPNEVTDTLKAKISDALRASLAERTTETVDKQIGKALPLTLGIVGLSVLLFFVQRFLRFRDHVLRERQEAEAAEAPPPPTTTGKPVPITEQLTFQEALRHRFTLGRRRTIVAFLRWLTFWGQIVVWVGGTGLVLALFPWTRPLSAQILRIPLNLLLVWFVTGLLIRIGDVLLDYLAKIWDESNIFADGDNHRESLRISTTIGSLKGLKTFIVYIGGITSALGVLGLPVGSVLAIGGIIAFAISLGFQNVVKDVVNGFLILMEDQYAVGDVISIGTDSGLVENMNLRITQLRDGEGRLITIPNSAITQVRNLTRTWSRVDFSIEIAYETDIDHALEVMGNVAQQMYRQVEWRDRMIDPPEVLGVDSITHSGMLVKVWIKTKPGQQWVVGREFRRRMRVAFAEHHIAIGRPQQESWLANEGISMNGLLNSQEPEDSSEPRPPKEQPKK